MKKFSLFQKEVLKRVRQIPKGKISSYKILAKVLGRPKSYRAIGNVLSKNPYPIKIPCHRVVRSDAHLSGYQLGQRKKIELLKKEGIEIKKGKIQGLDKYLYKW